MNKYVHVQSLRGEQADIDIYYTMDAINTLTRWKECCDAASVWWFTVNTISRTSYIRR